MADRDFHVVIFGATSFVGQIMARYMLERHGVGRELKWAIAGRSQAKLQQVRDGLGAGASQLPMLVADAADEGALKRLCLATRVVASTVGPYALYGSPLVKVCAETGTDYVDLTGEPQWIARMIKAHEATARQSGARIVHCCGFDSIPSDLGTYFLQRAAQDKFGAPLARVKYRVRVLKGGASGGTIASLGNAMREAAADPAVRKMMADPYALCPQPAGPRQPEVMFAEHDADLDSWVMPFVMAAINTRVVHRANALSGYAYGKEFVYDEAVLTGPGVGGWIGAALGSIVLGLLLAGFALPPTRWLLEKVVPKPGEGPSPEAQLRGRYDITLFGRTADGRALHGRFAGDRDPGYGSTAKILGEAAACLALDVGKSDKPGGFWTPATAMGDALIPRLTRHAGVTLELTA